MRQPLRSTTALVLALSLVQPVPALAEGEAGLCADGSEPPCAEPAAPEPEPEASAPAPVAEPEAAPAPVAEPEPPPAPAPVGAPEAAPAPEAPPAAGPEPAPQPEPASGAAEAAAVVDPAPPPEAGAEAAAGAGGQPPTEPDAPSDPSAAPDPATGALPEPAGEPAPGAAPEAAAQGAAVGVAPEAAAGEAQPPAEADAAPAGDAAPAAEAAPAADAGIAPAEPEPAISAAPEPAAPAEPEPAASADTEPAASAAPAGPAPQPAPGDTAEGNPGEAAGPVEAGVAAGTAADPPADPAEPPSALDLLETALPPELAGAAAALDAALSATDEAEGTAGLPAAVLGLIEGAADADPDAPSAEAVSVTETVLTEDDTRASSEDFQTTAAGAERRGRSRGGMTDLERAALVGLGALAVGVILSNGNRVVANTGDRVVVDRGQDDLYILRDDDVLIRQPGSNVRTETFADGSTRTIVSRTDGSRVITIRDATGRVVLREREDALGNRTRLIDDTRRLEPVRVESLPPPRDLRLSLVETDRAALIAALNAAGADIPRAFSLRQIREIEEVRKLVPEIGFGSLTFETGSAAIQPSEAAKLLRLGDFMAAMIRENPAEIFLVEGHTDAVGPAAFNLALSDRRAESVALALTEFFGVPPENMVIQGYGESDLLIDTQEAERANRRVAVRRITPLLGEFLAAR